MYRSRRPRRRSVSDRILIARSHHHTVDVPIPADGLGSTIHLYYSWCEANLPPGSWAAFHHSRPRARAAPADHLRFFFREDGQAETFAAVFQLTRSPVGRTARD